MEINDKIEFLWRCADETCSAAERQQLEQLLAAEPALRTQWQQIKQLHTALGTELSAEEPSMRFKANVLEAVEQREEATALVSSRGKAAIFIFFLCSLLLSLLIPSTASDQLHWLQALEFEWNFAPSNWTTAFQSIQISPYWLIPIGVLCLVAAERLIIQRMREKKRMH